MANAKAAQTQERLNALSLPQSGAWASTARQAALKRVQDMGLPSPQDEYWKYTNPSAFTQAKPIDPITKGHEAPVFEGVDSIRIVFVDGIFDMAASSDLAVENAQIELLSKAAKCDVHPAKKLYGAQESAGNTPVPRPLAALNSAFAHEGVLIHAQGAVEKPIHIIARGNTDTMLHHVITVDSGAMLTVLETGSVDGRVNQVIETNVAKRGTLHHVKVQAPHNGATLTHLYAHLQEESQLKSFTLTIGGRKTRGECVVTLAGENAAASVAGACMGGADFHHDDTVFITHDAAHCESRQVFKKVLRDGATGVFQGKILVKEGAQKTDGYQISQSLLLDCNSQFLAKPELEIYADDVACSHGSTSGAIDPDALFYLRARGVPHQKAIDLLTLSFMAEALDEIEDEALSEEVLVYLQNVMEA